MLDKKFKVPNVLESYVKLICEENSCPIRDKLYGGLPESGGYRGYTEFVIGAGRIAEAAHCILGSLGRNLGGNDNWPQMVQIESGHIKEEFEIIEKCAKEYSGSIYRERYNNPNVYDDYKPEHRESAKKYTEDSIKHIKENSPKLASVARDNLSNLMLQNDIPKEVKNVAIYCYAVVYNLANTMQQSVAEWPEKEVKDPYSDNALLKNIDKLDDSIQILFAAFKGK